MNIKEVIAVVNQMQADGVIESAPGSLIANPKRIYDYLTARGCANEREYIVIAGWPARFLPPGIPLVEEALKEAVVKDVDGTPTHVFTAEHLAAIALQTGRAKDKARLLQFIEAGVLDSARFQRILVRHDLVAAWQKFERQFLGDEP